MRNVLAADKRRWAQMTVDSGRMTDDGRWMMDVGNRLACSVGLSDACPGKPA